MFRLQRMLTRRGFLWVLAALSILAAALAFGAPGAAAQNSPSKPATPAPPNEEYLRKVIKWNPWFLAAASGDTKTIQDYLTSGTQVNARDTFGRTALYIATAYEHADVVRLLLKSGADPSLPSEDSSDDCFNPQRRRTHTALEIATRSQNVDIRSSLEDADGALIPLGSNENGLGSLPLLYQCIEENSTATLQALLEKESFIQLRAASTCEGGSRTFPDYVLSKGREQCYVVLLERAIGPRGTQAERNDLLTAAVGFCRTQDVRRLLGAGASLASVPMDYLAVPVGRGRKDLVQILLDAHLRTGFLTLSSAVWSGNLDIVKMLVDNGVSVPGENGNWALANAARQGKKAMVEYLIDQGADPNGIQIDGLTPLELAIVNKHEDVADYLILKGAKPITGERRALLLKPPREYVVTTETLVSAEPPSTRSRAKPIDLSRYSLYGVARTEKTPQPSNVETHRFLVFAGSLDRVPVGSAFSAGPGFVAWGSYAGAVEDSKPKEWTKTQWAEPGKIAAVAWLVGYTGSGGITEEWTSILLVRGNRVKPVLTWSYWIYWQCGVANHRLGKHIWAWDSAGQVLEIRLIFTDYVEGYSYGGGRLHAAVPSAGYWEHLPPSRVSETIWRYQLAGDEMRYIGGKRVEHIAGGFPVLDAAERYGVTVRKLVELNPELKGKVFCAGPVVVSTSVPPIDKDREN